MKCRICGDAERRLIHSPEHGVVCSRCYQRAKRAGKVYALPRYGELGYSEDGKPVCHVCGQAFDKVLSHVWQVHGMFEQEYKKQFGLETTKGIMSEKSTALARQRNGENYGVVVEENLLTAGEKTRFKQGSAGRTKDKISEYTRRKWNRRKRVSDGY